MHCQEGKRLEDKYIADTRAELAHESLDDLELTFVSNPKVAILSFLQVAL